MIVNLNRQEGVKTLLFPDNQPHVNITETLDDRRSLNGVDVLCSLTSSQRFLELLQLSNALDHHFISKHNLYIPYLMAARSDRIMVRGDSVDLKVIAHLINNLRFSKVHILDPHSDTSLMLIDKSIGVDNHFLVDEYAREDAILIIPDAGAAKKAEKYMQWNNNIVDSIQCVKHRDLSNGKITLKVLEPEKCINRNCVIIDDLCDGGGTFLAIGSQINPKHLTLIVTHAIFSKGVKVFEGIFDEVICSDSYPHGHNALAVRTIVNPFGGPYPRNL